MIVALFALVWPQLLMRFVQWVDLGSDAGFVTLARSIFGMTASGEPSPLLATGTGVFVGAALTAAGIAVSAWATSRGLVAPASAPPRALPLAARLTRTSPGRNPLYQKEMLWFWRDRGALVEAVLIPITLGVSQSFNYRGLFEKAFDGWNWFCGAVALCGTYFLQVVGPRSLISEGQALWLPLTWPLGLEGLLKAKARMWWLVASALVISAMTIAVLLFPSDAGAIALITIAWIVFARSVAERSVTLVEPPDSAGEPQKVSLGRKFVAIGGTLSFALGVMFGSWHLVATSIIVSTVAGAAIWNGFAHQLPFVFDRWSERLPPAPTLMHAVIAIIAMLEVMSLLFVMILSAAGPDSVWLSQSVAYGVSAIGTCLVTIVMLRNRGVRPSSTWVWPRDVDSTVPERHITGPAVLLSSAALGMILATIASLYFALIQQIPYVVEQTKPMMDRLASHPEERWWMLVTAVGFAPIAEEYLFRGLLYRELDKLWGGWKALIGSALFFGVYHPPLAWLPVTLVGVAAGAVFKFTGRLWPAVVLHAVYNTVVTLAR